MKFSWKKKHPILTFKHYRYRGYIRWWYDFQIWKYTKTWYRDRYISTQVFFQGKLPCITVHIHINHCKFPTNTTPTVCSLIIVGNVELSENRVCKVLKQNSPFRVFSYLIKRALKYLWMKVILGMNGTNFRNKYT